MSGSPTAERLRVTILAGISVGVLVGGVGGRLAMLALRLSSPRSVRGVESDDGFEIGRFTLGGSYNLLVVGAGLGLVGAAIYPVVARWLIGPVWFRTLTTALGAGAVVGSMLVHTDGIDFRLLRPTAFAIALFVLVPALYGALIGPAFAWLSRPESWFARGRRRWLCPLIAIACFPPTAFVAAFIGVLLIASAPLRASERVRQLHAVFAYGLAVRAVWLGVAVVGLAAFLSDAQKLL